MQINSPSPLFKGRGELCRITEMVFPSLRSLTFFSLLPLFANLVDANPALKRESRTSAPSGAVVVRASGAASGEYSTVQAAVDSLTDDGSDQVIFIYEGNWIFLARSVFRG